MKLEGIRVLDLSMFLPGPHLTATMADHGADVIRIEPPGGEPARAIGKMEGGMTVWFRNTHRGKRSIVLDLKQPEGLEAFLRLASSADVVLESFRPGVVDRLGIGYEAVRARNPRIVHCSISAFGQTGPKAGRIAHDLSVQADTGLAGLNRAPDGTPVMPNMPAADMAGSLMALTAILMALLRREKTGVGDQIDISMQDSLVSWAVNVVSPVFAEDRELDTTQERSFGGAAFYNLYRCSDGRTLSLGGSEIKFAANLLKALGREDLIPLCEQPPGDAQRPVREFLAQTFATQPLAHWEEFLSGIDVCWAPVRGLREALQSEHLRERGMVMRTPQGYGMLGTPLRFREEPGRVSPDAPALGEHTRELLEEAGYRGEALQRLLDRTRE
jgi:crotonobetainyl-CoA:carnitine CoA-transferase CaiB-like acyl-CoA transferase